MATVAEKGGNQPLDRSYVNYTRANAGEPNGSLTPAFVGEIVLDTTNNALWKSMGVANNTWVTLTTPF